MGFMDRCTMIFRGVKRFCVRNAPEICLAATTVAAVSTAIVAVKTTPKMIENITIAEEKKGTGLTNWEKVKVTKVQIGIIALPVSATIVSAYAGYKIQSVRLAQAVAAGTALLATNKELREQLQAFDDISSVPEVKKIIDEKETAQAAIAETMENNRMIFDTGLGKDRFYDSFMGITFLSDIDCVLSGIEAFQEHYQQDEAVDIYDLYKCLRIKGANRLGEVLHSMAWYVSCDTDPFNVPLVNVKKKTVLDENGEDHGCYIISYAPSNMAYDYSLNGKRSFINEMKARELGDHLQDHESLVDIKDAICKPTDIPI